MVLFIHLLWPDQTYIQLYTVCLIFWCLGSVKSCFCFAISWLVYKWAKNCLLIPHCIMVVSFLGAGNSRNRISPLYYFLILLGDISFLKCLHVVHHYTRIKGLHSRKITSLPNLHASFQSSPKINCILITRLISIQ